jgi:hypothetical protein
VIKISFAADPSATAATRPGEKSRRRAVLRAAASGKNILRLCQIRDADNNQPAVNAIKTLELIGDAEDGLMRRAIDSGPGISIRIVHMSSPLAQPVAPRSPQIIDAES